MKNIKIFNKALLKTAQALSLASVFSLNFANAATPYAWNNIAPVKTPSSTNNNGKTVLFDVSHGGVEGNADWVIDGAFSDFADALVIQGYTVKEYRGIDYNQDGVIRFHDDRVNNTPQNEAVITYDAIKNSDVFVLAETNRPFTLSEQTALIQYVNAGKGLFFIADHYDADRNLNTWDATEVFNGYNRSDLEKYNLGGQYGDWRNPKDAYSGWLVENFGIRFRFNAIDYKAGISGIKSPSETEGITQGAQPVLMAGGATLAIVDEQKAKGLVYFSENDKPTKWRHAKDSGLYFGGEAEGPYVAIAKSGKGKAAFIGDSSPIEDTTPKYKRQDNGNSKKTYPGWTDSGNAAQLSVNIINWLAKTENYTSFNNEDGHISGMVTPDAMATQEFTDPNNGNPWGTPASGFNAWDTDSYKNNAFNAAFGDIQGEPDPTPDPTTNISVSEALKMPQGSNVTVVGKVTAAVNGIYALELSDINDISSHIFVKLESTQRSDFNPQLNPEILNQHIIVTGIRNSYMNEAGIRNVSKIALAPTALSVKQALASAKGELITLTGKVKSALNDIYALVLVDNNSDLTINIKLESNQRSQFSPQLNPELLDAQLLIKGVRDSYMGGDGVRQVSNIELVSNNTPTTPEGLTVSQALALQNGTLVTVIGEIKSAINGQYALALIDADNQFETLYIKLESNHRDTFSPQINPQNIGKKIRVTGIRNDYMNELGVKYVSDISFIN
ncbi:DUF6359 domain-containing protein [Pseudoalteromonas denitrificans]|uniref:Endonuclease YhcR N-terminal domain-containing protein n=1 Tax=Pseudoalteromonas denitrificans DSM 6059 TaxID=1123010 RepID=A0A1I1KHE9_9GAMM|nr:DUF6359 domain-containing protein [Pseudoalteromonas denitrificans]SFC60237.1 hypothetical protein SAMN02745724_02059 [Pseudoalteromonas denitrificans DSM 6059]